jgi:hypothetical protein
MRKKIFVLLFVLVVGLILFTGVEGVTVGVTVYETGHNLTQISQAAVYVDNGLVGKTDETGYLEFSHPETNSMEITVIKRGYEDWTGILGGNTTSLLIEMKKKNLVLGVTVYDADMLYPVSGAEVTISADGLNMSENTDSNGSVSFPVRAEGLYDLSIHAPNYQTRAAAVEMGIDNKSVEYWLYRDTHFAIVVKDNTTQQPVEDAEVLFDGVNKGTTDLRGALTIDLPRDKVYQITIRKDGYQDYVEKRIISNDEALVTLFIKKAPATVFIFVYDETKSPVENAEIFLGNTLVGTTDTFGRATMQNLSMETYPLSVRHSGYLNQSFTLELTDMAREFTIQLEYETANLTIATLGTDKKPIPETLISINGKQTGITDKDGEYTTKLRLNIPYTINATKEGYNSATVRTEVTSSTPPVQTITLQKSMNWLLVGLLFLIGAVLILIFVVRRRTRGSQHPRHGRGGL